MDLIQSALDFVVHIDAHLIRLAVVYGVWLYAILFVIVFCETGLVVTPFLPGDSLLFVAGTLCALPGNPMDVRLLAVILVVAAVSGDTVNYSVGRVFGKRLFRNPDSRIFKPAYLRKTHEFYEKHGEKTIVLARFVPIVRTFAPFVAGMGRMHYRRFLIYNVVGGVVWVLLFICAGYFFGSLSFVQRNLKLLMLGIIVLSVLPVGIEAWRMRRKKGTVSGA